jgi:hypothetical protein
MALGVAEIALVSPLGLTPSDHVFFFQAEVNPYSSGVFTTEDGDALPIHDCPWIPARRPWSSRIRLLAKQALARVRPSSPKTPLFLIASQEACTGEGDLSRFFALSGHEVRRVYSGSAAYVTAMVDARKVLDTEPEVVILAVDSLLSKHEVESWFDIRYSGFTRNPLPPSEGAAAMRLVNTIRPPLAGKIHSFAAARSDATDENDLPTDGKALTRVLAELALPRRIPLVVGPRDVDTLRMRDFHLASARHHEKLEQAEMPSFEGRIGRMGNAAGWMSAVFAMAWLRHGLPLTESVDRRVALAWARSHHGEVAAMLVGDERS